MSDVQRFLRLNGYLKPWYKQSISLGSFLARLAAQHDCADRGPTLIIFMAFPRSWREQDIPTVIRDDKRCAELASWLHYVRAFEEWCNSDADPAKIEAYDEGLEYDGTYSVWAGDLLSRLSKDVLSMDVMQFMYLDSERMAVLLRSSWINKVSDGWYEDDVWAADTLCEGENT